MRAYTRAMDPAECDGVLAPYVARLDAFERRLVGVPYRKDHRWRTWEYASILQQLEELDVPREATILDTGSGGSFFPPFLVTEGYSRVVISDSMAYGDITGMVIQQCYALGIRLPIITEPVERLSMPDGYYDVTLCVSVIEHLAEDQYERGLNELCRVTRPGGYLFITSDYFRDQAHADASPFRGIQHNCLTEARVLEIPSMIDADFVGGLDLSYKGDFVNGYSFCNLVLQKRRSPRQLKETDMEDRNNPTGPNPDRTNRGLEKEHVAYRIDPITGQREEKKFTQRAWIDRDKTEGWKRDDEPEAPAPTPPAGGGETPPTA